MNVGDRVQVVHGKAGQTFILMSGASVIPPAAVHIGALLNYEPLATTRYNTPPLTVINCIDEHKSDLYPVSDIWDEDGPGGLSWKSRPFKNTWYYSDPHEQYLSVNEGVYGPVEMNGVWYSPLPKTFSYVNCDSPTIQISATYADGDVVFLEEGWWRVTGNASFALEAGDYFLIDSEKMQADQVVAHPTRANVYDIYIIQGGRALDGTTKARHSQGAPIYSV